MKTIGNEMQMKKYEKQYQGMEKHKRKSKQ